VKLPQEVVEICHRYGIYGKTIYIPKKVSTAQQKKKELFYSLLEEMETMYEQFGETFDKKPQSFTVRHVRRRYKVSTKTASLALKSALNSFRRWLKHERKRLQNLTPEEKRLYLHLRAKFRTGEKVEDQSNISVLAFESVKSCPWR